jgi:hypothetical protein
MQPHKSNAIIFVIFHKTFHDSRFMGENITNCLLWFANNALQYLWVYNINKQVVLTNKKSPKK